MGVNIAGIGILEVFGSCDLDLNPMTFIFELDLYCLELYRLCKCELPVSRLSKVIFCTSIHTDRVDQNYKACSFALAE